MMDKLLEISADEDLKMTFDTCTLLASLFIKVKTEYPELAEIALNAVSHINLSSCDWIVYHECH